MTIDPTATTAEVDADPEVADLEQRIADGDTKITAGALAKARTDAAGRVRFNVLRRLADDRAARRDAAAAERAAAEVADEHARQALGPYGAAEVVAAYDGAVDALRALTVLLDARNAALFDLLRLPAAERVRGARFDAAYGATTTAGDHVLPLDDVVHRPAPTAEVVTRVLRSAGLVASRSGTGVRPVFDGEHVDDRDHWLIAVSRAQLAED